MTSLHCLTNRNGILRRREKKKEEEGGRRMKKEEDKRRRRRRKRFDFEKQHFIFLFTVTQNTAQ